MIDLFFKLIYSINMEGLVDLSFVFYQMVLALVVFFAAKHIRFMLTTGYDDLAIMQDNKNSAAAYSMVGFLAGVVIVMSLAFQSEFYDITDLTLKVLVASFIGVFLMAFNIFFVDFLILGSKKVNEAIKANVVSVGIIQAFGFIAAGLQFYIANSGVDEITIGLFMVSVPYFILGQFIMVLTMRLFIMVTSYDDMKELFTGNIAVAVSHGFLMISISLLIGSVASEAMEVDMLTTMFIVLYSFISILFIIFGPRQFTSYIIRGILKEYNGKIENAVEDGRVEVALVYGLVRLSFAMVILLSFSYNLFEM